MAGSRQSGVNIRSTFYRSLELLVPELLLFGQLLKKPRNILKPFIEFLTLLDLLIVHTLDINVIDVLDNLYVPLLLLPLSKGPDLHVLHLYLLANLFHAVGVVLLGFYQPLQL